MKVAGLCVCDVLDARLEPSAASSLIGLLGSLLLSASILGGSTSSAAHIFG